MPSNWISHKPSDGCLKDRLSRLEKTNPIGVVSDNATIFKLKIFYLILEI
jgi:hypothetical protein